jgi:2,3-diaminopropionate biosynthesis protein SbnA
MLTPGKTEPTPVLSVCMSVNGVDHEVLLKLEGKNPSGSIKYRTAVGLVRALNDEGRLTPASTIIESTSGNLGVALALVAREHGYRFHAVVDPKVQPERLRSMEALGAVVDCVESADGDGNFLEARLHRVQQLLAANEGYVWSNQYESPANPAAHAASTGPEIWQQTRGGLDTVFVAVSTGGTAAGIAEFFASTAPHVRVIAVDAVGSTALGFAPGVRQLTGIGSSRPSTFLKPEMVTTSLLVSDEEAFAMCGRLRAARGVAVGGSSGAVLAACARYVAEHPEIRLPLCLCPDDGEHYGESIFGADGEWPLGADQTRLLETVSLR